MHKKKVATLGAMVASLASLATIVSSPSASASLVDTNTWCGSVESGLQSGQCYNYTRPGTTTKGVVWLGTYGGPGGWKAWCIDFLYGTDFSVPGTRSTVATLKNSSGTTIGNSEKAALAYLATKHSPASANNTDAAAIALIIREVMSDGYSNTSGVQFFPGDLKVGQSVQAPWSGLGFDSATLTRANELWSDASKWVGEWTIALSQPSSTTISPGGTVNYTVTVKSGTGVPVSGEKVSVSYTNASGPSSVTTNSSGQATISLAAADSGDWGLRVSADSPGTDPEVWTPNSWTGTTLGKPSSSTQRVLGTAAPTKVLATASGWTNYIGSIGTSAVDKADGDKYLPSSGGTITDTVSYKGLEPGKTYTVSGELMDKATGQSTGIKGTATFTPTTTDGTTTVDFAVGADQAGKQLVVFETVTNDAGDEVASHTDINDVAQTVFMPKIGTTAVDKADGDNYLSASGGTITDTVAYSGLQPGQSYTVSGELFDKATGESTGITGEATFTPTSSDGETTVDFVVPAEQAGKVLVAFETVKQGTTTVADHTDINDDKQAVSMPKIGTTAVDKADGDKYLAESDATVVDTVAYSGLRPGQSYTVTGELMDKATGQSTGITGSTTFTPTTSDGTVDVTFSVPADQQSRILVAFETMSADASKTVVADHTDIGDVNQTVYRPGLGTTAVDKADGDKYVSAADGGQVVDTVAYEGLQPGKEYTVTGELMDKATGASTGITSQATFTAADSGSGTTTVVFDVPATQAGKTLVAFETVSDNGAEVIVHADINDAAQTVSLPDLATSATDQSDGDKTLPASGGTITDVVTYSGLQPGQTYTVSGELMSREPGLLPGFPISKATGITGEATFTPTQADGTVDVEFAVPADQSGKTLVAFESLTEGQNSTVIAEHTDISDEAQTVTVDDFVPASPQLPNTGGPGLFGWVASGAALLTAAAGGSLWTLRRRRRVDA